MKVVTFALSATCAVSRHPSSIPPRLPMKLCSMGSWIFKFQRSPSFLSERRSVNRSHCQTRMTRVQRVLAPCQWHCHRTSSWTWLLGLGLGPTNFTFILHRYVSSFRQSFVSMHRMPRVALTSMRIRLLVFVLSSRLLIVCSSASGYCILLWGFHSMTDFVD